MSNILIRFALATLPFFLAWCVISTLSCDLVSPGTPIHRRVLILWRAGLSFGAGIISSSLIVWFFLQWPRISSLDEALPRVFWTELVLSALALVFWWRSRNARHRVLEPLLTDRVAALPNIADQMRTRKLWRVWWMCAFFSALVFATATWSRYYGEIDAWVSWNMHARFFSRGGAHWTDYFNNVLDWSHPDYPLSISLSVARGWAIAGFEWNGVPIVLGLLFAIATTAVLMSSLYILRGSNQAILGGIVLLGTPFFALHSASQTADVPLGFYFLSSLVCLALLQHASSRAKKWALIFSSGLFAGGAAWTKNEGSLWVLCWGAILLMHTSLVQNGQTSNEQGVSKQRVKLRAALTFAGIFILAASPCLLGKISIGSFASSEMLGSQGASTWQKLRDISRWRETFVSFLMTSQTFGLWACPSAVFLWYYARLSGLKTKWFDQKLWPSRVLPLMCGCLFAVFLATPYPIDWHLANSVNRLFLQMWPCAVFTFLLHVKTPEEIYAASSLESEPKKSESNPLITINV